MSYSKMYSWIQIPGNQSGFVPASLLLLNINKINFACQENAGVFPGVFSDYFFPFLIITIQFFLKFILFFF